MRLSLRELMLYVQYEVVNIWKAAGDIRDFKIRDATAVRRDRK